MNKIKLGFIAIAILAAVGGAFATKPCVTCENSQQYIWTGTGYVAVGLYGEDFDCVVTAGVCTYYRADPWQPTVYTPCHEGVYTPL